MKKQEKKIYRPIMGQRWYEKFLDWATREETYHRFVVLPLSYGCFLLFGGLFLAKLANLPILLYAALGVWVCLFLNTLLFAIIGALGGTWELRVQKKLRKRVCEYISAHGQSTYNELVEHCMALKIHLGIDYALEIMFDHRELVSEEAGIYRLPTDEDRKRWREESLAEFGVKISFEELEQLFALDLKEIEEGTICIEFSFGERDSLWICKYPDESSGTVIFSLHPNEDKRLVFTTFAEAADAEIFDGQNLRSAWGDATITFINDRWMPSWLARHLPSWTLDED